MFESDLAEQVRGLGLGFGEDGLEVGLRVGGVDLGELLLLEGHFTDGSGFGVGSGGDCFEYRVGGECFEGFDGLGLVADQVAQTSPATYRAEVIDSNKPSEEFRAVFRSARAIHFGKCYWEHIAIQSGQ
jgi:hypothetical protein